jgi:hypothetical protein
VVVYLERLRVCLLEGLRGCLLEGLSLFDGRVKVLFFMIFLCNNVKLNLNVEFTPPMIAKIGFDSSV